MRVPKPWILQLALSEKVRGFAAAIPASAEKCERQRDRPGRQFRRRNIVSRPETDVDGLQLLRVRRICATFPQTSEKLSHGEPTFFVRKRVFAMFSNSHHGDGHVAVLIPVGPGLQATLIHSSPEIYYYPAYVGVRGWVGIELDAISEQELISHLHAAWSLIAPVKLKRMAAHRLGLVSSRE
jgi:hypothetical protein